MSQNLNSVSKPRRVSGRMLIHPRTLSPIRHLKVNGNFEQEDQRGVLTPCGEGGQADPAVETAIPVPGIMCCILLAWAWGNASSFLAFLSSVITSAGFEDCSNTGSLLPVSLLELGCQ